MSEPVIIEGKLAAEDSKRLIFQHFEVPENTSSVRIHFEYSPTSVGPIQNHVNLLIYDSLGRFMGRYDRGTKEFTVGKDATCAAERTLPLPGEWTICFENHYLFTDVRYKVLIETQGDLKYTAFIGELHTHSVHSDGVFAVQELSRYLKEIGFDFFFLTDHSNITGWREIEDIEGISCFPGQELNTFNGHALILGCKTFIDWKEADGTQKKIPQILREVHLQNGLIGVAHPFALGDPLCVGCKWMYDFNPFVSDFVEVWNSDLSRFELNFEAIGKWIENLKKGRRTTATAGRDLHRRSDSDWLKTVVLVRELSLSEVIYAIKFGKTYLGYTNGLSFTVEGKSFGQTISWQESVRVMANIGDFDQQNVMIVTKSSSKDFGKVKEIDTKIEVHPDDFVILIVYGKHSLPIFITNPVFVKRGEEN
ncbi:CehA/McbA family metallohydrolase [Pseudothermotoga sp. U03pept]|uniref:CehA/McbA family metallohydrolase n=1 Tax=Pseudothermotoga sp. U03pept TaxID=3447012 RepID=UPI003EFCE551